MADTWAKYILDINGLDNKTKCLLKHYDAIARYGLDVVDLIFQNRKNVIFDAEYPHANFLSVTEEDQLDNYNAKNEEKKKKEKEKAKEKDVESDDKEDNEKKDDEDTDEKEDNDDEDTDEKKNKDEKKDDKEEKKDKEDANKNKKGTKGAAKKEDPNKPKFMYKTLACGKGKDGKVDKKSKKVMTDKEKVSLIVVSAESKACINFLIKRYAREIENFYEHNENKFPNTTNEANFIKNFIDDASISDTIPNISPFIKSITDKVNVSDWIKKERYSELKNEISTRLCSYFKSKNRKGYETAIDYFVNLWIKFIKVIAIYFGINNYEKRTNTLSLITLLRNMSAVTYPEAIIEEQIYVTCESYNNSVKNRTKSTKRSAKTNLSDEVTANDSILTGTDEILDIEDATKVSIDSWENPESDSATFELDD